jgi:formylglycine-generating enzyme required for sulfatase activity
MRQDPIEESTAKNDTGVDHMSIKLKNLPTTILILAFLFICVPVNGSAEEVTIMLPGDVPMVLVRIPSGTFMMGSPAGERGNIFDNEDQHQVTLTEDYFMAKTEVTQQQWQAVMGTPMPDTCGTAAVGDNYPVYCVTWADMAGPGGFIEKLNEQQDVGDFRLPSEAEWERAARAGTTTRFSHGDVLQCGDDCETCATHDLSMAFCGNNTPDGAKPVGERQANAFGLHDMHGNIWELVNDFYEPDYGTPVGQAVTDPTGPAGNSNGDIVFRGGGAVSEVWLARSAARLGGSPFQGSSDTGFRIAASGLEATFGINAGISDAWFNSDTAGQGFFIVVYPDLGLVFLAWFTFETSLPDDSVIANLGWTGHRWLTAIGPYTGTTATLDIELTTGGVFDSPEPAVHQVAGGGTITVEFQDCENGTVTYDIPSIGRMGVVQIRRVAPDNVALCNELNGQ